ncbi:hypothetical protein F4860DRAFT_529137 [Xylaria cubensis]|nr:hypothetical protein F4860DRAFT_529137 [Xylaria cubensis]
MNHHHSSAYHDGFCRHGYGPSPKRCTAPAAALVSTTINITSALEGKLRQLGLAAKDRCCYCYYACAIIAEIWLCFNATIDNRIAFSCPSYPDIAVNYGLESAQIIKGVDCNTPKPPVALLPTPDMIKAPMTDDSRERALSSEPSSTRPNPFDDDDSNLSARKPRKTSLSGSPTASVGTALSHDNTIAALDTYDMKVDTPEPTLPSTPDRTDRPVEPVSSRLFLYRALPSQ